MHDPSETIGALATPPGEGALAVIRLSGPRARDLLEQLAGAAAARLRPRRLASLRLRDLEGALVDHAVATWLPAPHTYTGDEMVEISTHGGPATVRALLAALFELGVCPALPGEFTYRRFLAGKMDLTQAEAVAELVVSRGERARKLALEQMEGSLRRRLAPVRERLLALLRDLEAGIDFVEEDIEFVSPDRLATELATLRDEVDALLASARGGRIVREGLSVVLAGAPNVGKSSLFNALLESERAIVTAAPGTTRDALRESWTEDGLVFHLQDTAGLRRGRGEAERQGVARTEAALGEANLVLWVADASRAPLPEERERWAQLAPGRDILVANKMDLAEASLSPFAEAAPGITALPVSALRGDGIAELRRALVAAAAGEAGTEALELECAVNRRQEARLLALRRLVAEAGAPRDAVKDEDRGQAGARTGIGDDDHGRLERERGSAAAVEISAELLAPRLREALAELDELTGDRVGERILDEIFANFCIGK